MSTNSSTTMTGRYGKFEVGGAIVARTKMWSASSVLATKAEWGDSDTAGYTARAAGRKDGTFNANGVYDTEEEQYDLFEEGDTAESVLWMRGATSGTNKYWFFPRALCFSFDMSVNMETQEVIGWSSSWGADGIFYKPGHPDLPARDLPSDSDSE